MAKLFDGVPDLKRVALDTGLGLDTATGLLLELAWITKTITRLGKGYLLGDHGFSRPDSTADRELSAVEDDDNCEPSWHSAWITPDELSATLADRTGCTVDEAAAVVASVTEQVDEHGGGTMKVAGRYLELERVVEEQLLENPSVLDIWGWSLTDPRRQVHLGQSSRADIVGQRPDGTWVVVELKRGAALASTADQILRYIPLVSERYADGAPVLGLVIADGVDEEFHDRIMGVPDHIEYLPTRCLDLPACRPQQHQIYPDHTIMHDSTAIGTVTLAADGITAVGALPSPEAFNLLEPNDLWPAGRHLLTRPGTPLPLPSLPTSPPDG